MIEIDLDTPMPEKELMHHGVKGMKWGVRRYKEIRKSAKKDLSARDASSSKKYYAEQRSAGSARKLKERTKELGDKKQRASINPKKQKGVDKAQKRVDKTAAIHAKNEENRKIQSRDYNRAQARFQKKVNEAAKLPVYVTENKLSSSAKRFAKGAMTEFAVATITGATTGVRVQGAGQTSQATRATRSDRFDMAVKSRQATNQSKK